MAKVNKAHKKLLEQALEDYKVSVQGWDHIYKEAVDDTKFVYDIDGGQWPEKMRNDREKDGRPVITVNKLQKFVRQQCGEQQQNRPRMNTIPVDSKGDPGKAELYNGLIRKIEYLSDASVAYDTAYKHSLGSSIGYFRIATRYIEGDSFDQEIYIDRVVNPQAVHFDPHSKKFQLEDARYCFIEEMISKKDFERLYPNAEITDFSSHSALFGEWIHSAIFSVYSD